MSNKKPWDGTNFNTQYDPYRPMENKTMSWNNYQKRVVGLLSEESKADQLTNGIFGMNEKAGECAGLVKKFRHHNHELDKLKLAKKIGDVLFYCASTADAIGYTLEDVALLNMEKLSTRYPTGKFTKQDSIDKKDEVRPLIYDPEHYPEDREY